MPISRRHFLLALSSAAAVSTLNASRPPAAVAAEVSAGLEAAAADHQVPISVIAAFCVLNHDGSNSQSGLPTTLVDGSSARQARDAAHGGSAPAPVDQLGEAVRLSGRPAQEVVSDPAANLQAAAALLADAQRQSGGSLGQDTDPADWIAAATLVSGRPSLDAQSSFADGLRERLEQGTTLKVGRDVVRQPGRSVDRTGSDRALRRRRDRWHHAVPSSSPVDAPRDLGVEWVEAPYLQTGAGAGDYGNHDLCDRPRSPSLDMVVIHDTECSYDQAMNLVQDPNYLAWNYTVRSSDGKIAQHLRTKDIGWHAGNWYVNTHAVGVEHEGYAISGTEWYTDAMYRRSARLVAYLCEKYRIPVDRGHILGHDQVPALKTEGIRGMHWDPGPFWDWERYFSLLGSPLDRGTTPAGRRLRPGSTVRILPGFAENLQVITGSSAQGTLDGSPTSCNFVPLRTAPDDNAPLLVDVGQHPNDTPTTDVADVGARASAGTDYVVADVRDDWIAVWYLGARGWLRNSAQRPVVRVVSRPTVAEIRHDDTAVFGAAYPEASAFTNAADVVEAPPLVYRLGRGQRYVVVDDRPATDYHRAQTFDPDTPGDHVDIVGRTQYLLVYLGHRLAFIKRDDVRLHR